MQAEIKLQPFTVPDRVRVRGCHNLVLQGNVSLRLSAVEACELDRLCAEFRAAVFKQAGKIDPVLEEPKTPPILAEGSTGVSWANYPLG